MEIIIILVISLVLCVGSDKYFNDKYKKEMEEMAKDKSAKLKLYGDENNVMKLKFLQMEDGAVTVVNDEEFHLITFETNGTITRHSNVEDDRFKVTEKNQFVKTFKDA